MKWRLENRVTHYVLAIQKRFCVEEKEEYVLHSERFADLQQRGVGKGHVVSAMNAVFVEMALR